MEIMIFSRKTIYTCIHVYINGTLFLD